eukprot:4478673-Amphidinium_carterae.1
MEMSEWAVRLPRSLDIPMSITQSCGALALAANQQAKNKSLGKWDQRDKRHHQLFPQLLKCQDDMHR